MMHNTTDTRKQDYGSPESVNQPTSLNVAVKPNSDNASQNPDAKVRDVDGGWAWVVLAGVTIWDAIMGGSFSIMGILYLGLLDLFQAGPVTTSWVGSAFGITSMIACVPGAYMADYLSSQKMRVFIVICLLMSCLGAALCAWADNITTVVICYGVITGFFAGLIDPLVLKLPGIYFDKKRTLAYGIAFAVSSTTGVVLPIIMTLMIEEFSAKGAMLIYSAFWLQPLLVPAAMTPLKRKIKDNYVANNKIQNNIHLTTLNIDQADQEDLTVPDPGRSNPLDTDMDLLTHGDVNELSTNTPQTKLSVDIETRVTKRNEQATSASEAYGTGSNEESRYLRCGKLNKYCHFITVFIQLLKCPGVVPLSLCLWCGFFGYLNQFLIFPPLADELHMSKLEGALLVSLPHVLQVASRIIVGFTIDKYHIQKDVILIISFMLSGVLGIGISFSQDANAYMGYSIIFGAMGGTCVPLSIPMMMDLVDPEQYGKAAGSLPVLVGLATAIGAPILTLVAERTGTFVNSLRMCAGMYFLGVVVYIGIFIYKIRRNKNV